MLIFWGIKRLQSAAKFSSICLCSSNRCNRRVPALKNVITKSIITRSGWRCPTVAWRSAVFPLWTLQNSSVIVYKLDYIFAYRLIKCGGIRSITSHFSYGRTPRFECIAVLRRGRLGWCTWTAWCCAIRPTWTLQRAAITIQELYGVLIYGGCKLSSVILRLGNTCYSWAPSTEGVWVLRCRGLGWCSLSICRLSAIRHTLALKDRGAVHKTDCITPCSLVICGCISFISGGSWYCRIPTFECVCVLSICSPRRSWSCIWRSITLSYSKRL